MKIAELFEGKNELLAEPNSIVLDELTGVSAKAISVLTRLAKFHQVSNLTYDKQNNVWTASASPGIEPFIRDAKHVTSAAAMGNRMTSESGVNEATTVSKAEATRNSNVEEGNTVCIKNPETPHKLQYGKLLRYGRSGLAMIKLNNGEKISVPPSWVFANEQDAWPAPKWTKKSATPTTTA